MKANIKSKTKFTFPAKKATKEANGNFIQPNKI